MRNEGQKQQGSVAGVGRANGFVPSSLRTLSGYLKIVSSGASTVASSVRLAASAASSIVDRDDDIRRDQVLWAGFDNLECEGGVLRRVLLLGLRTGFQVWDVDEAHNVHELISREDGHVHFLQMLPSPLPGSSEDKFASFRPLLVVCGHGCVSHGGNGKDALHTACNGGTSNGHPAASGCFGPFVVQFYSVTSQAFVHLLKFRSAVYSVRCSSRVVAVSQSAQIHCFNASSLEREYTILTDPVITTPPGPGGVGYGPLAVGPRWLAYSGVPVAISGDSRVTPQHLTHSASFPDRSSNGRLVAQFARGSSRQLTAGIAILGDIGYKKLSRYCSELLPDSHDSMHPEPVGQRANGFSNGHFLDMDSVGMVIVRDIVSRSVVVQFRAHKSPISALCFDPSGMLLVTASVQGHNINVFKIMAGPSNSTASDSGGSSIHLYKLQRGFTNAVIQDISFSDDGCCIVVTTSRGTNHLFGIPSSGRAAKSESPVASFRVDGPNNNGHSFINRPTCSDYQMSDQQIVCMSSSPITLSAVSRVRSRDNSWRDTVTGAAAAAAGRVCSLPGVTACSFHHCKGDMHTCSLEANYHFLVFSSSGFLVQYALGAFPNGVESLVVDSGAIPHEGGGNDSKLMVTAVRKWNICQRQCQREKDGIDIYGDNGRMDCHGIASEGCVKVNGACAMEHFTISRATKSTKEKHHLYISEAELQMHHSGVPLWARSEICFLRMIIHGAKMSEEGATNGEIEIEKFLTDPIEVRKKHLVPVFDHLPSSKSQDSRTDPEYSIFGSLPMQQATDISHLKDITSSHSNATEGGACIPFVLNETKETIGSSPKSLSITKDFVNSDDSPRISCKPDPVNGRDREHTKMEAQLIAVNNNNETSRRRNPSDDDLGDEFDQRW